MVFPFDHALPAPPPDSTIAPTYPVVMLYAWIGSASVLRGDRREHRM